MLVPKLLEGIYQRQALNIDGSPRFDPVSGDPVLEAVTDIMRKDAQSREAVMKFNKEIEEMERTAMRLISERCSMNLVATQCLRGTIFVARTVRVA